MRQEQAKKVPAWQANLWNTFRIDRIEARYAGAIRARLITARGPMAVNIPKRRTVAIFDLARREVCLREWFCLKTGLIEE